MAKRSIPKIKSQIDKAIARKRDCLESWKNEKNPQIVEMRTRCEGELNTLYAISDALKGDMVMLNILANGYLKDLQ